MKSSSVAARALLLVAGAGFGLVLAELLVRVVAPQLHPIYRGVHVAGDAGASDSLTVFVLGDSQTFGFGVLEHETFSARLAAIMAERRAGTGRSPRSSRTGSIG